VVVYTFQFYRLDSASVPYRGLRPYDSFNSID